MEGAELARAKYAFGVSLLAAVLAFAWLFVQPKLLTTPDKLVIWLFSVALILAAPIVLRMTRSFMAVWVLHAAAVLTPIAALAAIGSPHALEHAFWLTMMPAVGALLAGRRGLLISAALSIAATAGLALLGNYGLFGPVSSPVLLISPLLTTVVISLLLAMQVRLRERAEERLLDVRTDAETAHEAAVHADRLSTLGLLAAGVAHGVNNPLTLLLQNVNTLLVEFSSTQQRLDRAQVHSLVSELSTGLQQVRTAVEALGTFSDSGTTADESTHLESVLVHVVHLIRLATGSRIHVDMRLESLGHVSGTKFEVGQLFLNLLVNAVQAAPDDELEHHI
ncbi:MAG: signal transduction histidine kinase, partial [Kiritimatiellia bacterium]